MLLSYRNWRNSYNAHVQSYPSLPCWYMLLTPPPPRWYTYVGGGGVLLLCYCVEAAKQSEIK